jgi:uncharacterized protein YjdB
MKFLIRRAFLVMTALCSCVGTDYLDDKVVGEKIVVTEKTLALLLGEQEQLTATYFNNYGIEQDVAVQWQSSKPEVAEVSNDGLITAKEDGQSTIQPFVGNLIGPAIQVTVVSDISAVATVQITMPVSTSVSIGSSIQLQATVRNVVGNVLSDYIIEWFSENGSILSVDGTGKVQTLEAGIAGIHAKVNGVKSNSIDFTVVGTIRSGSFTSAGGYKTIGTAQLEVVNNQLMLTLSNNFDTDFALGTFIYLANSTNGSTVRANGLEIAQIFSDGGKTFNVSQLNNSVQLTTYRYVIVLCKPASVTFGFADLN